MSNIEHRDIFELLAIDLDMPPEKVAEMLRSKGASAFTGFLKKKDFLINSSDLYLSSEIKDPHGKVLINSGIPLNKYLSSLLDKYVRDDQFTTSPFTIDCNENVLHLYQKKSKDKVNKIISEYIYKNNSYSAMFDNIPSVKSEFDSVMDNITANPKGVCTILRMTSSFETKPDLVLNSINSSLITLGLSSFANPVVTESSKTLSMKAGIVCLLQRIKDIAGEYFCESSSGEIIRTLVNDESLEQAVIMQNNADLDAAPIFSDKINRRNYYLRVLVTVSLFVDLVYQNKTDAQNLEVHKSLYELSEQGYADKEITILLGKLFLPEAKYLILEHAYEIKNKCPKGPVIWSSVGDMLPVKFLCLHETCTHSGTHKTFIPKDVVLDAAGANKTSIPAGLYFTCNLLTNNLQSYYKTIVRKNEL